MSMFFCEHHGRLEDADYVGIEIYDQQEVCTAAHEALCIDDDTRAITARIHALETQREQLLNLVCARRGPALAAAAHELSVVDHSLTALRGYFHE